MKRILPLMLLLLAGITMNAQVKKMLGDWYTVDDDTNKKMSVVSIYQGKDGLYYGKISELLVGPHDQLCTECPGADHNKKMEGMVIIRGMKADGDILTGGKVLDPDNGKFYYAKISLKDGKLVLRGSLDKAGLLGRSQTWIRK